LVVVVVEAVVVVVDVEPVVVVVGKVVVVVVVVSWWWSWSGSRCQSPCGQRSTPRARWSDAGWLKGQRRVAAPW